MLTDYAIKYVIERTGTEPITLAELTNYIKQSSGITAEDNLMNDILSATVNEAQEITYKQMNDELTVTAKVSMEDPDSDGNYIIELPYANSVITITDVTAIDWDGDTVIIESSDYTLRGNMLRFEIFSIAGYYFEITYTATITAGEQTAFKESLMAYAGYKYYNRGDERASEGVKILGTHIDRTNWI